MREGGGEGEEGVETCGHLDEKPHENFVQVDRGPIHSILVTCPCLVTLVDHY